MGSSTFADNGAAASCFNELPSVLKGAMSSDPAVRQIASGTLEAWISIGSFGRTLMHYLSLCDGHEQQFGAVLLHQWVQKCWESEDNFGESAISEEDRDLVRTQLLQGLQSMQLNNKVQKSFIRAVATIAEMEWPEKWLALWPWFLKQCEAKETMGCAIRCMHAVLLDLNSQVVRDVVPQLFPVLGSMFPNVNSDLKRRIVLMIRSCYSMLEVLAQAGEEQAQVMLIDAVNPWIDTFINVLQQPLSSNADSGLHSEIFGVLEHLVSEFPKQIAPALPRIMPTLLHCFSTTASLYENQIVNEFSSGDAKVPFDIEYDSDGETIGIQPMITQLLEFLRMLVSSQSKRVRKCVREFVPQLSSLTLCYIQITQDQIEKWEDDSISYVADEEDDSVEMNVRNVATLLLGEIEQYHGAHALETILQEAQRHLNSGSWKMLEAALVSIGKVSSSYKRRARTLKKAGVNSYADGMCGMSVNGLLNHLFATVTNNSEARTQYYVQARAIWCFAQYMPLASSQQAEAFMNRLVAKLDSQMPLCIQFQACRALLEVASTPAHYSSNTLSSMGILMPPIVEKLIQIMSLNQEETLHTVLETLCCVLKASNVEVVSKCFQPLLETSVNVWMQNVSDPVLASDFQELFQVLANIKPCLPYLVSHIKEPITAIFQASSGNLSGIVEAAIELVTLLAKRLGSPLPEVFFDSFFKQIYEVLCLTDDASVLQAGAECMTVYVRLCSEQLLQWKYLTSQKNGVDCVIDVIAKLLQKDMEDSAALHVGKLITQVIQQIGAQLLPETIRKLLTAVIERLSCAKSPCLIQSFCIVFARLLHSHQMAFINILSELNALEFVFSTWLFWQPEFYGTLDLNVSLASLTLLYSLRDSRLENLVVKGDIVEAAEVPGRRMRTRSQKKGPEKFDEVPLYVRLLTIIIRSTATLQEEDNDAGCESSSDESVSGDEGNESFEKNDPVASELDLELQSDPLFDFDIKGHLLHFLQGLRNEKFAEVEANQLKESDKAMLHKLLCL